MMEEEESLDEQREGCEPGDETGARIGMWLFLFSELMFFGVLFIIYSVYRAMYADEFHTASRELNLALGSFNTFVLLTSSLTMVLSLAALQRRDRELSICLLASTICLGGLFLLNKFFEWREDFLHGFFPGLDSFDKLSHGQFLFFNLYFLMTGLHGLHVIAGMTALSVMLILVARGRITPERYLLLDNTGLYWHLVDVIWIFLLPLFYVIT
jgi:cytochrome c oxidase subunit III